ncbi:MAG: sulfotransferase [Chromatocurvus sp.]
MLKARGRQARKSLLQHTIAGRPSNCPASVTFVTGVQRSGTNMLMNILDRSLETDVYMEKDPRAFDRYAMRDVDTISALIKQSRAKHVVIKALLEADSIAHLMQLFHNTRALWLYRNYDDMVNSYLVSWPGGRNRLDEIMHGANGDIWQAKGMTPDTFEKIKEHYRPGINDASALALFWYYRNQIFFDQRFDSSDAVMLLRYDSLVTDPAAHVRKIADFLGISAAPAMTGLVSSRSVRKRQKPAIEKGIRDLCDAMNARLQEAL